MAVVEAEQVPGGQHPDAVRERVARLRNRQPQVKRLRIPFDPAILDEFQAAEKALETARRVVELRSSPESVEALETATRRYEAADQAMEAASDVLILRALGRRRYEELVGEHPPRPEDDEVAKGQGQAGAPYNGETFPAALLAEAVIDPPLTLADAQHILDEWSNGDGMLLFLTAMELNASSRITELGKGSGGTPGSSRS